MKKKDIRPRVYGPRGTKNTPELLLQRLMNHIDGTPKNQCWEWQGSRGKASHGQTWAYSKHILAHRLSYLLHKGPIPEGLLVCHSCDNPPCINPKHLFLGTFQDNIDDMMKKGRHAKIKGLRGSTNGNSKLNNKQVKAIKKKLKDGVTILKLAKEFKVSRMLLYYIRDGKQWTHIK